MSKKFTYDYERPGVTTDVVILSIQNKQLKILLSKRDQEPFQGVLGLPGGFVHMEETLEETAKRNLHIKAGIDNIYLEQLYTFGKPNRDSRTRIISVAYLALVDAHNLNISTQARQETNWYPINSLPKLAFDHNEIVKYALERIKAKISYSNIALSLLPDYFTLTQLQEAYEIILGHPIDKRNFRKKIATLNIIKETPRILSGQPHRPAKLYTKTDKSFTLKLFD